METGDHHLLLDTAWLEIGDADTFEIKVVYTVDPSEITWL